MVSEDELTEQYIEEDGVPKTPPMIWIAYATYGPGDYDPIIVAATSEEAAARTLTSAIEDHCDHDGELVEQWIEEHPFQIPVWS